MNNDAKRENLRALANALGIAEDKAGIKLKFLVKIYYSKNIPESKYFSDELYYLIVRTVENVSIQETHENIYAKIAIATPDNSNQKFLFINISDNSFNISIKQEATIHHNNSHPLLLIIAACYSSASILKTAIESLPFPCALPMCFSLHEIIDPYILDKPIDIGKSYMAGAGAIGNAVLWSFRHLNISGELHICDDDNVSSGNINRQLFFNEGDIGKGKAVTLSKKARGFMPALKLVPRDKLLQNLEEAGDGFWLNRLISAVDSRRARRTLQGEFPKEVFDASTTDISEIVIHYHKQPTDTGCMACVYSEDDSERNHETNISEALGVSIDEIKTGRISPEAAKNISLYLSDANINPSIIEGEAYDSLYKSLCGQGKLNAVENGQILAPFCFVSMLAGVMLCLELVNRLTNHSHKTNYNVWKISAWSPPYIRMRKSLSRKDNCPSCSSSTVQNLIKDKWG